jgi:hypothetical protein
MPVSRRYHPEKPDGESSVFGYDFSPVIPPGVGIVSGSLRIFLNDAGFTPADTDFSISVVGVRGRMLYATLGGGISGTDYLLVWTATDSLGNVWPRAATVLVSPTS